MKRFLAVPQTDTCKKQSHAPNHKTLIARVYIKHHARF